MKVPLEITINGEKHQLYIKPSRTLLEVLREALLLTGTKEGCGSGKCGTCTVILNGKPVNSCLVLAATCDGGEVETIEGMAAGGEPHPLQKSFVEKGAVQCGFCTPGMIMTSHALLRENPDPSREEIKDALSGNLCRCTGYTKIIEAVELLEEVSHE